MSEYTELSTAGFFHNMNKSTTTSWGLRYPRPATMTKEKQKRWARPPKLSAK